MKKVLLLVTSLVLVFGLAACGGNGGDDKEPSDLTLSISGVADKTIYVEEAFNVFTGVTASGSDNVDYTDSITADSIACVIEANGDIDTSTTKVCGIDYTVVADGKVARASMTLTVMVEVDEGAPLLKGWNFDDAAQLDDFGIFIGNNDEFPITLTVEDGAMKLVLSVVGNPWEPRLDYQGLPLVNGETYTVSFRAKASEDGKPLTLKFGEILASDPWFTDFKPGQEDIVYLTTDWVDYTYSFVMSIENINGGPTFEFGDVGGSGLLGTVWMDDIEIRGGSTDDTTAAVISGADDVVLEVGATFDAAEGVTAVDFVDGDITTALAITGDTVDTATAGEYNVIYTSTDEAGNIATVTRKVMVVQLVTDTNNQAVMDFFAATYNGTIGTDADPWFNELNWGQAVMDYSFINGVLTTDLAPVLDGTTSEPVEFAGNFWDNIVKYPGLKLQKDVEYKLVVDVKTDVAANTTNSFILKIEDGVYGTEGFWAMEKYVVATDEWSTVEMVFTFTNENSSMATLLFMVGGIEQVLEFKNLDVQVNQDNLTTDYAPVISGVMDQTVAVDVPLDVMSGVSGMDFEDGEVTVTSTVVGPNAETVFDESVTGDWVVTYTTTDADSNTTTETATITIEVMSYEATNLIPNGTFDIRGWNTWMADWNSTAASITYDGTAAVLDITNVGDDNWNIQLFQEGFEIVNGTTYRVTFDAMSTVDREINVKLIAADDTEYTATIAITTTMTTYTADFTVAVATQGGKIDFELGAATNGITVSAPSVVTIDNVMLEEYDGSAVVTDTNLLINSDFAIADNTTGWTSWSRDWDPVITASLVEEWNELVFRYDGVGDASWNNQLNFDGIDFEDGVTYKLVFDAKGDAAREFKINIYDGSNGIESGVYNLTDAFQTFEYIFTYTNSGDLSKVEFQLGAFTVSAGTTFYLDNVEIFKLIETE